MKTLLLSFAWFFLAAGVIIAGAARTLYIVDPPEPVADQTAYQDTVKISTALATSPKLTDEMVAQGEIADARVILVQNFLDRHNSPLVDEPNFAQTLVDLADKYEIDFRLLPAIAMQESNLCKVTPPDTYNCLGLGIHERGTWGFTSYAENFEAAAKILKKNYVSIGLTTPEQIMKKYTPKSDGSWASSVNQWMAEMRYDDRQAGRELKTNADLLEFVENSPIPEEISN
jgi:hypothetical protein